MGLAMCVLEMCAAGRTGLNSLPEQKPNSNQIVLHDHGRSTTLDQHSAFFKDVLTESNSLFLEADTSYRLLMSQERIVNLKQREVALEIKFSAVQSGDVLKGHKVHFTSLLIPLSGQFADGTVFFAGKWERQNEHQELKYASLQDYLPANFVRNTRGLNRLKEQLKKMAITVD